jgi:hypothetical protein
LEVDTRDRAIAIEGMLDSLDVISTKTYMVSGASGVGNQFLRDFSYGGIFSFSRFGDAFPF